MADGASLSGMSIQRENIVYDKDGNAYIPATQRPDGTWRKARKVKPDYIPQDEVPLYQSKGREPIPRLPPGAEFVNPVMFATNEEPNEEKPMTRAQKKNARKKQKKKERAPELLFEVEEITSATEQVSLLEDSSSKELSPHGKPQIAVSTTVVKSVAETTVSSTPVDNLKRIRTLRKKLKQIEDLEVRIASGDITKPDQDQLKKIAKKEEFLREMEELATQ